MTKRSILLVGSVPCASSEEVFRLLAGSLGDLAPRYPDGETGKRIMWVRWQRHVFDDNPDLYLVEAGKKIAGYQDTLVRPFYALRDGVDLARFSFKELGYAREAIASYEVFARLRQAGAIPPGVRFQVSLPTVVSLLTVFVEKKDRSAVEAALERAMQREVDAMAAAIPADMLAIQWDAASEIIGHDGGADLHYADILSGSVERLVRHVSFVPAGVEAAVHLCYGDPGHKHVIEPKDTATCVAFANRIGEQARRRVDWIHLPIPRDWDHPRYFAPLRALKVPAGTGIYLGLIHYTDGIEGTARRLALARQQVSDFGLATECGFGRRDPATVGRLLEIHRAAAALD